jgi:DNA polymerase delta subunit 1
MTTIIMPLPLIVTHTQHIFRGCPRPPIPEALLQPHLHVAKKIMQRTGAPVPSGARVPFVFIEDAANPDGLLAERAEDPEYVRANSLKLDVLYYLERQLESPITALLEMLVPNVRAAVFEGGEVGPLMEALVRQTTDRIRKAKRVRTNKANRQREITAFFSKVEDATDSDASSEADE